MLRCVTLTGADESVRDPNELAELAATYPFLEFGILVGSRTQVGGHRFPSIGWIDWLCDVKRKQPMRLSLHICGQYLREVVAGNPVLLLQVSDLLPFFERCQLNFHGEKQPPYTAYHIRESFVAMAEHWKPEIIFQLDGVNELWRPCLQQEPSFVCSGLFDKSHGAGISPTEWPKPLLEIPVGYAGGIGPDNVAEEIRRIVGSRVAWPRDTIVTRSAALDTGFVKFKPTWIDIETKLFNEDGDFDLGQCRQVASNVVDENVRFPGLID